MTTTLFRFLPGVVGPRGGGRPIDGGPLIGLLLLLVRLGGGKGGGGPVPTTTTLLRFTFGDIFGDVVPDFDGDLITLFFGEGGLPSSISLVSLIVLSPVFSSTFQSMTCSGKYTSTSTGLMSF